jgi:hypothetical protein
MERMSRLGCGSGFRRAHLVAGGDLAGKHTAEREETALVRGGDHLGHVHHEWPFRVAVHHGFCILVIKGTLIECCIAVLLGGGWGGEVVDHHLQQRLVRRKPRLQC